MLNNIVSKFIGLNQVEEVQIVGDGNCLYRCLSQALDETQENHKYYRELIYNYIEQNKTLLSKFFIRNENETNEEYNERYNTFIKEIGKDGTFAGDFEISTASIILNRKIVIYYNTILGYNFLNEYKPNNDAKDTIYLLYRNNIHFNLLKNKTAKNENKEISIKDIDIIHKNIENNFDKINLNKIKEDAFKIIFDKKYVKYRRKEIPNLYNEIYQFLKEDKLPKRLISPFMKNVEEYWKNKKNSGEIENKNNPYIMKVNNEEDHNKKYKRKNFRDLIKNKYEIKDDRLYYKYERIKGKVVLKKIPYELEVPYIFYKCHIKNSLHFSIRKSKENLLNNEYYYEGINKDLIDFIKTCPKCTIEQNMKVVKAPLKQIIENGPHFRLEMDLWYLPGDISKQSGYNYVLDIIDVFSKWLFSFPLVTKSSTEILVALRKYIESFGLCKKLQTDNGLEFKNILITNYCIENNIERLYSPPYHPQANGAVEAAHKIVQKFINDYFYTLSEEEFSIDLAILDAINYHNNTKHSSTLFTPLEIKDITDIDKINEVISNMKKTVGRKISKQNDMLLEKDDKLLINNNIGLRNKKKEIYLLKNKKKGNYKIPAVFLEYKSGYLSIKVMKKYLDLLEANKDYLIKYEIVRLVNEEAYNFYLNSD